ncbi:MAG: DUF3788 family protein [Eubacteriaceae bacterium]
MAQQLLRNPDIELSAEIIAQGLGIASSAYTVFLEGLKEYDVSLMNWRFYSDGKAWLSKGEYKWTTARGTNKVKPLFWLSIWEGFFKISFFFSTKAQEELLALPINQDAKSIIENAKPMGKTMKYIPVIVDVDDEKQLNNIYVLLQFRKEKI